MNLTQFLIFEANRTCNLGAAHAKCPNLHPERCKHCDTTRPLADQQIVAAALGAYGALGFRGYVGFHYYNEPLLAVERVVPLCRKIRAAVGEKARFVLWTNGTKIPPPGPDLEQLRVFDLAWVTRYDCGDYSRLKTVIPKTTFVKWQLDGRASQPLAKDHLGSCARPFSEIVFDFYGNMHLCCLDWRGEARLGNLHDEKLADLVQRFVGVRDLLSGETMSSAAPELCRRCVGRHAHVAMLVPEIAREAKDRMAEQARARAEAPPPAAKPAAEVASAVAVGGLGVVFVSYRVPEHRLRDHFAWNGEIYRRAGARVFVVVDRIYAGLPDYVRQLVYDDQMPVFNLSKTKNLGIRHAIESGCARVVATDVDIAYSEEAWSALAGVASGSAIVPTYRMASCWESRARDFVLAPKATGTVSMAAVDWRRAHFDERCVGYGSDDAILLRAIERAGIRIDRAGSAELWHIAHAPGTPQKEFDRAHPRIDHWGRADGFNPENFAGNRKFYQPEASREADSDPRWGLSDSSSHITMVMTHYGPHIHDQRLFDCIAWNREVWRSIGARVIVVTDRARYEGQEALPEWVRLAVFPVALERFNLALTSNWGIRLAGGGIVVKTDPDVLWPREAAERVARVVDALGWCPKYRMATGPSDGELEAASVWEASKGTLALSFAHWDSISGYDERMSGYGIEDGDGFHRAGCGCRPGRDVERSGHVFHIAHTRAPQAGGNLRKDCWGRSEGFNPKAHQHNMSVRREAWASGSWGRAAQ